MNAKEKNKKGGKIVLAALLATMALVFVTVGFLALRLLDKLHVSPGGDIPSDSYSLEEEEDPASFGTVYDITDATNLKNFLFQWWHSGGDGMIRYSKDVVNVLLVGVDNNDGEPGAGRSDSMMLASVNKRTRKITLLSFLRDSYCFFEVSGAPYYNRLNTSYYFGGPAGLMNAVSRLYKIRVDKYITVDFRSFPKLIDALGGVTVEVTKAEARYLNRNAKSIARTLEPGVQHLNGTEALAFSRIRKLDGDPERTNRQQKVIESILQRAREANLVQLYNALDLTLPYVQTNYARAELLGMLPSAMAWLRFEVVHMISPVLDYYQSEDHNAIGGTINGMSIFIVDYPKAARRVQLALYGESNIDLEDDAHRNAYIEEIFASAGRRPSYSNTAPRSTQPYEDEDGTGGEETTARSYWPFWPWGGGEAETQPAPQETEPMAESPW
jgi:LCP family protein required for cell wall assembly